MVASLGGQVGRASAGSYTSLRSAGRRTRTSAGLSQRSHLRRGSEVGYGLGLGPDLRPTSGVPTASLLGGSSHVRLGRELEQGYWPIGMSAIRGVVLVSDGLSIRSAFGITFGLCALQPGGPRTNLAFRPIRLPKPAASPSTLTRFQLLTASESARCLYATVDIHQRLVCEKT